LHTSCEFYEDDVTVTLFINIEYGDVCTEIVPYQTTYCYSVFFCRQKNLIQIIFTLGCMQWIATSVLRSQQYKSGVRKC